MRLSGKCGNTVPIPWNCRNKYAALYRPFRAIGKLAR